MCWACAHAVPGLRLMQMVLRWVYPSRSTPPMTAGPLTTLSSQSIPATSASALTSLSPSTMRRPGPWGSRQRLVGHRPGPDLGCSDRHRTSPASSSLLRASQMIDTLKAAVPPPHQPGGDPSQERAGVTLLPSLLPSLSSLLLSPLPLPATPRLSFDGCCPLPSPTPTPHLP